MANDILTPKIIAARALATLYNEAVLTGLVYRDYDPDFTGKQGDTITIRTPWTPEVNDFDRSTGIVVQNVVEGSTTLTLDTLADVSLVVTAEELTLALDDFAERILSPAMEAIVQKVDTDLAAALIAEATTGGEQAAITALASSDVVTASGGRHGLRNGDQVVFPALTGGAGLTAGTTVYFVRDATLATFKVSATDGGAAVNITSDVTAGTFAAAGGGTATRGEDSMASSVLLAARTTLSTNKLPSADRAAVLSPAATEQALSDPLFQQADKSGSTDALREAAIGRVFGLDSYESQVFSNGDGVAFHKQAVALASRTLSLPMGVGEDQAAIASYKGLGLRVVKDYDITYKQDVISIDFLYGIKALRPAGAVVLDLLGS
ncbi:MAG TPA: P22 phage major capsid protein family protein [Baekduia sp.]|jgi:hypothetical protein